MISVSSRAIAAIGWEDGTLGVRFHGNSTIYTYHGMPEEVFESFLNALSKGEYYHLHIEGRYG